MTVDNASALRAFVDGEEVFDVPRSNELHTPLEDEPETQRQRQVRATLYGDKIACPACGLSFRLTNLDGHNLHFCDHRGRHGVGNGGAPFTEDKGWTQMVPFELVFPDFKPEV